MKLTKKQKKQILIFTITLIIILIGISVGALEKSDLYNFLGIKTTASNETNKATIINTDDLYSIVRIVDGDTIVVNYKGTEEKVRLIGVNTPESVHKDSSKNTEEGQIASEYTKNLLTGKKVKLEFDVSPRDKYGRLLAYVYLDEKMVNKTLLEEGYAKIATYPPNVKYVDEFTKIQKKARENKKGFWNSVWN